MGALGCSCFAFQRTGNATALTGTIGAGAVVGAFMLPRLHAKLSGDALIAIASLLYAGAMVAVATVNQLMPLCLAMADQRDRQSRSQPVDALADAQRSRHGDP